MHFLYYCNYCEVTCELHADVAYVFSSIISQSVFEQYLSNCSRKRINLKTVSWKKKNNKKNNDVTTWDTLNTVSLTRCHSDKGTQDGSEGTSIKKKD